MLPLGGPAEPAGRVATTGFFDLSTSGAGIVISNTYR